ncbi:MAG: hypothetical protein M1829_006321 [Trizodia sp. TS-e1964]|nr:MAG: hypothetical protein M1829_006321 [Trizodia sp. TS-e1964]
MAIPPPTQSPDSTHPLLTHLHALSKLHAHTANLTSTLSALPPPTPTTPYPRASLTAEILANLAHLSSTLELLALDVADLPRTRDPLSASPLAATRRRAEDMLAQLQWDVKQLHAQSRVAQRRAKKVEAERERARWLSLLARRDADEQQGAPAQSQGPAPPISSRRAAQSEDADADAVALATARSVTDGLRRIQAALDNEVHRSRFAEDMLQQSTASLTTLSTSYSDLGGALARARGLLGALLRSAKSDTWYLETAVYVLLATLAWLVFRRLLYGPLWWVVYFPARLLLRSGVAGVVFVRSLRRDGGVEKSVEMQTNTVMPMPTAAVWDGVPPVEKEKREQSDSLRAEVEHIIDAGGAWDVSPDEQAAGGEEGQGNAKKRIWEGDDGVGGQFVEGEAHDEL